MRQIFLAIIDKVEKAVSKSTDSHLFYDRYEHELYKIYRVEPPTMDMENISIDIDQETMTSSNTPNQGMGFEPGVKMDYALFSVPIKGDSGLLDKILLGYQWNRFQYIQNLMICFKQFSQVNLISNDAALEAVKAKATVFYNGIQEKLD